jgi:hypothetical protein
MEKTDLTIYIKKVIIELKKDECRTVPELIWGSQHFPAYGSREDNLCRIIEDKLIRLGYVEIIGGGDKSTDINRYYEFQLTPKGLEDYSLIARHF